jgi:protein TonB
MPSSFHHPSLHRARFVLGQLHMRWLQVDRLDHVHFIVAIVFAFMLHMAMYGLWRMLPRDEVVDIPVRVLNIKLAEPDDVIAESLPDSKPLPNAAGVEQMISKVVKDIQAESDRQEIVEKMPDKSPPPKKPPVNMEKLMAKAKPFDMRTEGTAVAAPVQSVVATQYVREAEPANLGEAGGKDIITRYEQLISAWIDKFKPEKLMVSGQPDRAVASIRIRIDRRGNIRFLELEKSSGLEELDRAALDTVRRANPVPAAPAGYPSGDQIEFIVPVVFSK